MPLFTGYLEQISQSAKSIADLEFPPPNIFTNAQLGNHEITNLIRDTEPHERALFSLDPESANSSRKSRASKSTGDPPSDQANYGRKSIYATAPPAKQSAVARVLGNDLLREIRLNSGNAASSKGGVDVEVLLRGAEKLCDVYTVPGASEKITAIRNRHLQIATSVAKYEEKVLQQQSKLSRLNNEIEPGRTEVEENNAVASTLHSIQMLTENDLETEEAEIKELEARKEALEDRVAGMEKDLGGLLR